MMIRKTSDFEGFRELLDRNQLDNLRARLINMMAVGELKNHVLTVIELGTGVRFFVYVDRDQGSDVVWLLGGHWVRKGEPTNEFTRKMERFAHEIAGGRSPE